MADAATVEARGFCYDLQSAGSFLPQAGIVNTFQGGILLYTFYQTLKTVNSNNKRALAGIRDNNVLAFSIHITLLQACTVWAIIWAVYKLFSTDKEDNRDWEYYHATAAGLVFGISVLIELAVLIYVVSGDVGSKALRRVAKFSVSAGVAYGITCMVVGMVYPGTSHLDVSKENVLFFLITDFLLLVVYSTVLILATYRSRDFSRKGRLLPFDAIRSWTSFLSVYYLFHTMAEAVAFAGDDAGRCLLTVAQFGYFGLFSWAIHRTLRMDSNFWVLLFGGGKATDEADFYADSEDVDVPSGYKDLLIPSTQLLPLNKTLGAGAAAEVLLYQWAGSEVVVKKLSLQVCPTDYIADFKKEVSILRALKHKNIVDFKGVYFDMPNLGIVMEYCRRGNLYEMLAGWRMKRERAVRAMQNENANPLHIALGIAEGMQYFHNTKQRLVHRDLKSLNILIDLSYVPKLADFGESQMGRRLSATNRTPQRSQSRNAGGLFNGLEDVRGTPAWMAPEAAMGEVASQKSDVYSFGVVLWELLTWQEPFVYENTASAQEAKAIFNDIIDIPDRKESDAGDRSSRMHSLGTPLLESSDLEDSVILDVRNGIPVERVEQARPGAIKVDSLEKAKELTFKRRLRPPLPNACSDDLKLILSKCWEADALQRPSFDDLVFMLKSVVDSKSVPITAFPMPV